MNCTVPILNPSSSMPVVSQPAVYSGNTGLGKRARATGETLEYLKEQFTRNPSPSIEVRREICARTGMHEKVIRIWFQNYRAKMRKSERSTPGRHAANSKMSSTLQLSSPFAPPAKIQIPVLAFDVNSKYSYIEASAISAGTWHRSRHGFHSVLMLAGSLHHLSPKAVLSALGSTNMLIILSKTNAEMNYFFMPDEGSRMLFRIFYPLSRISETSLVSHSFHEAELQISLAQKPQFAVHYPEKSYNKWEMSPDFTEGNQISSAHSGLCGSSLPHIITGPSPTLEYLRSYVTSYVATIPTKSNDGIAQNTPEDPNTELSSLVNSGITGGQTQLASDEIMWSAADMELPTRNVAAMHPPTPASSISKLHEVYADLISDTSPTTIPLTPYDSRMAVDDARNFLVEYQQPGLDFPLDQYGLSGQALYAPPAASCVDPNVNAAEYFQRLVDMPTNSFEHVDHEMDSTDAFAELIASYTSAELDVFLDFDPESHADATI